MKYIIISIGLLFAGIAALNLFGGSLVQEIIQPVKVSESPYNGPAASPAAGKTAPYFELADLAGKKVRISDLAGSPLVLVFWTTWNPAAADQIKIIDDLSRQTDPPQFKIMAIDSQEDRAVVANFIKRGGYQVGSLLDENGAVSESYKITTLPAAYFIDAKGFVRDIELGTLSAAVIVDKAKATIGAR